jgi:hypothetical protein
LVAALTFRNPVCLVGVDAYIAGKIYLKISKNNFVMYFHTFYACKQSREKILFFVACAKNTIFGVF